MMFLNYEQPGYGQYNLHMECSNCETKQVVHVTGHSWEFHLDDCPLSDKHPWMENHCADIECDECGEASSSPMHTCACEEIKALMAPEGQGGL